MAKGKPPLFEPATDPLGGKTMVLAPAEHPLPVTEPEQAPAPAAAPGTLRRCRVDLAHSPSWEGEAVDEQDAVARMKRDYGIIEADHPFSVHWLDEEG